MHNQKVLGQKDMVLFTVSAILLLDTLAAGASIGVSSISWWLFLGVVFFIPFALICAEMGCSYPEQGGIYAWVRDAFGGRWGSRVSWAYWVNTAAWMPAVYILFAGIFKQLFVPDLSLFWQIMIGITLSWIAVLINVITLEVGKWVPNLGAILKVIIFIAIIVGAFIHTQNYGMANQITFDTLKPDWGNSMQYIPAIIYGMLGFELVSAGSEEMKDPARDVPRSIFISGLIIIVLYTLGTIAVLAAIPVSDINLVEGLVDTLNLLFDGSEAGRIFVIVLGIAALYTFFSNGVTWALGCNRAAAEAALEGELPALFAIESETRGTPVGAAVAMGITSTVVLALYGFMAGSNEELFWSLFTFSAVIFLLPYLGMLLAFVKLRISDSNHPRPFEVPGNLTTAILCAGICFIVLTLSIFLFIYIPGEGIQWPVLLGAIALMVVGEFAIRIAEKNKAETGEET
jgi:glutamate:GABA antiporter